MVATLDAVAEADEDAVVAAADAGEVVDADAQIMMQTGSKGIAMRAESSVIRQQIASLGGTPTTEATLKSASTAESQDTSRTNADKLRHSTQQRTRSATNANKRGILRETVRRHLK